MAASWTEPKASFVPLEEEEEERGSEGKVGCRHPAEAYSRVLRLTAQVLGHSRASSPTARLAQLLVRFAVQVAWLFFLLANVASAALRAIIGTGTATVVCLALLANGVTLLHVPARECAGSALFVGPHAARRSYLETLSLHVARIPPRARPLDWPPLVYLTVIGIGVTAQLKATLSGDRGALDPGAFGLVARALQVASLVCSFAVFVAMLDVVVRLSWAMAAARLALGFAMRSLGDVLADSGPGGGADSAQGRRGALRTQELAANAACDALQRAFAEAFDLVAGMNFTFERAVPAVILVFASAAWPLLARVVKASGADTADSQKLAIEGFWAVSSLVVGLRTLVAAASVGDTYLALRRAALQPGAVLALVRRLGRDRADALLLGLDKSILGFEMASVPMTSSTVLRVVFGIGLSLAFVVLEGAISSGADGEDG